MFERFDHTGRRVVVLAQEHARLLGHNYVGTEHLLLGVLAEGGPLVDALGQRGVTLAAARELVQEIVGPAAGSPARHLPFTPRAKEVLELSLREALRLGHRPIGAPHVLLGLLREGQGIACQALLVLGADLQALQRVAERVAGAEEVPGRVTALPVSGVRAALHAVEEALGPDASVAMVHVVDASRVQVVVEREGLDPAVLTVVHRTEGWQVEQP